MTPDKGEPKPGGHGPFVKTLIGPVFAGIAGCRLGDEAEIDLGAGIMLKKTFAHLMSPLLMAFAPPEPGQPHPAPWAPVRGSRGIDIYVQLGVPSLLDLPSKSFDNINTIWFVAALLRLHTSAPIFVAALADRPFEQIAEGVGGPSAEMPIAVISELVPRYSAEGISEGAPLPAESTEWLRTTLWRNSRLLRRDTRLNQAFQAFDHAPSVESPAVGLLVLWGAIEHLFSREPRDVTPTRVELHRCLP